MTKYEEIEKLQELKTNGTITDKEFEAEKQKILNTETTKVKKDKKKTLKMIKIIITVIIAIAVIVGAIFLIKEISDNIKIKQEENKLQQINSEELQEKIIKKLEADYRFITPRTIIGNQNMINNELFDFAMIFFVDENKNIENPENFVFAFHEGKKGNNYDEDCQLAVPLFKIESDENGKFKNIIFNVSDDWYGSAIANIIRDVFETEYGIDTKRLGWLYADYSAFNKQDYILGAETVTFVSYYDTDTGQLLNRVLAQIEGKSKLSETPEISKFIKMDAFGVNINKK